MAEVAAVAPDDAPSSDKGDDGVSTLATWVEEQLRGVANAAQTEIDIGTMRKKPLGGNQVLFPHCHHQGRADVLDMRCGAQNKAWSRKAGMVDIRSLIDFVQNEVERIHGITLHPEVKRLGFQTTD